MRHDFCIKKTQTKRLKEGEVGDDRGLVPTGQIHRMVRIDVRRFREELTAEA